MTYPATQTIIKLSRPYKFIGRDEVKELTMREPTVRDRVAHEKNKTGGPLEREVVFVSSLCGLNPEDVYQLAGYDYDQLTKASNDFLLPPEARGNEQEDSKTNSSETSPE